MCVLIGLGNILSYAMPYVLKLIVNIATSGNGSLVFSDFVPVLIAGCVVLALMELCLRTAHLLEIRVEYSLYERVVTRLYGFLLNRSSAFFEERFSGALARRIESVSAHMRHAVNTLTWEVGWQVGGIVMTFVLLLTAHWWLVAAFFLWFIYFCVISAVLLSWQYRATEQAAKADAELSGTLVDTLGNSSLVHNFAAHAHEYKHYKVFMSSAIKNAKGASRVGFFNSLHQGTSIVLLEAVFLILSVLLFLQDAVTVGDLVLVAALLPAISGIVWGMGRTVVSIVKSYAEVNDALAALRAPAPIVREGAKGLVLIEPTIEFKNIRFTYPNALTPVLENFTLRIHSGEKVGLVGGSGAGKSTVVKLLLRSYDAQVGEILVSGQDVSGTSLSSVREAITFVPQEATLFNRSLRENILYAKSIATQDELVDASKRAHADEFISMLPKGYDTMVGERGVKLSGGQRQRIALARAMLKNSPILVLDEATSALDSESEMIVQRGLQELFQGKTVLAIAHRLSTLRKMDRILVLEGGKIVEDGAPQDLLAREDGLFRRLWSHQKSGFIADKDE